MRHDPTYPDRFDEADSACTRMLEDRAYTLQFIELGGVLHPLKPLASFNGCYVKLSTDPLKVYAFNFFGNRI
jgi:hypothetical protein